MHLEQSGNDERISGIVVNKRDFVAKRKIAVDKRVLIKIEKHSSSCSEKGKTMRSRISRSLWHRLFFAAIAATTIRAILPFSLRFCERFLYFQNSH